MKLIVGLGNPGPRYAFTRHNVGFLVLEALAAQYNLKYKKSIVVHAMEVKALIEGQSCSLMMPLTFMNNSGPAVKQWMDKKGLSIKDLLVVCDDMALDFGQMRLRPSGTAGGHNGTKSIIEQLDTKEFTRLRLGVGRPRPSQDAADYVLSDFTSGERKLLPGFINEAVSCVASWVVEGTEKTMNQFNVKKRPS